MKKLFFLILFCFVGIISYSQRPEMVEVKGGTFTMGDLNSGISDQIPSHDVTVSDFYISKYEVTFEDFELFCNATGYKMPNDGNFGRGKQPVINVSWEGAIMYCNWMSSRFHLDKVYELVVDSSGMRVKSVNWNANGFRLPTEAEWEYASKGGSQGGTLNKLEEVAWYDKNSDKKPHDVGTLKPNSLGIYDMQGNAWEWCWDFYGKDYYSKSEKNNPRGPVTGSERIYRGGNFSSEPEFLNFNRRFRLSPQISDGMIGIRLVQSVK